MSAAQLALFPAPEEIAAPDLIGCGLSYMVRLAKTGEIPL